MRSAERFTQDTGLPFERRYFLEMMGKVIESDDAVIYVHGLPATGHSAAVIVSDVYSPALTARVISTQGVGGLKCFRRVERWARRRGCSFLIADSLSDARIQRFYRRREMDQIDVLFRKVL